jgi:hypothetical protein
MREECRGLNEEIMVFSMWIPANYTVIQTSEVTRNTWLATHGGLVLNLSICLVLSLVRPQYVAPISALQCLTAFSTY